MQVCGNDDRGEGGSFWVVDKQRQPLTELLKIHIYK